MSECPFCGLCPFEYVDVGVGHIPVAVNCCHFGPLLFEHYADAHTRKVANDVANALGDLPHGEERLLKAADLFEKYLPVEGNI